MVSPRTARTNGLERGFRLRGNPSIIRVREGLPTNRPESPDLGNILRRFLNVYAIYHCKGCVPQSGKPTVP